MVRFLTKLMAIVLITCLACTGSMAGILAAEPELREGDRLLLDGHAHAALTTYRHASQRNPDNALVWARLGLLYTLRNEPAMAQTALAQALGAGIAGADYDLVRLTQGVLASRHSGYGDPQAYWQLLTPQTRFASHQAALQADQLLQQARYGEAEALYRQALLANPTPVCARTIHYALALLRASSDPATAKSELALLRALPARSSGDLADLLLHEARADATQLEAVLASDPQLQPQLLGQFYLEQQLYGLAESQFRQVAPEGPLGLAAITFLAYGRWLQGDQAGGIAQLREIVQQYPDQPRARALLALAALGTADLLSAREQLMIIERTAPNEPATHLAWGQWYAAQRDYLAASAAYEQALNRALPEDREIYALYLARFHLDADFEVCGAGLAAAETALNTPAPSSAALAVAAQARLVCGDPEGSRRAATAAIERDPTNPEAYYRLGQVLGQIGDSAAARINLIEAADRDLGGVWQQRAENQLTLLGMEP
jgi:Flp pilus assembly protein TadD